MKSLPVKPRLVLPFCGLLLLTSLTFGTYATDDHQLSSALNRISDQGDETEPEPPTDEGDESTDIIDADEDVGNAPTPRVEDESTDTRDEEDESTDTRDEEDESTDILDGANESTEARDEEDRNAFTLGLDDDESTDIPRAAVEKIDQVVQQIPFGVPEEREVAVALLSDSAEQAAELGGDSSQFLKRVEEEVAADPQGDVANMIRAYAEEGFTPDDTRRIGNKIAQGEDVKEVLENEKAQGEDVKEVLENEKEKSSCLIATAAFGSELAPQVELLRNFRDNYILSTAAGSSFMNVFNAWYYSFSPYIADYEREQPWLKQITRIAIYPLLGVLQLAEKAYLSLPGEYGALAAGATASSLIGAIYFWPIGMIVDKRLREAQHSRKSSFKYISAIMGIVTVAVISSIIISDGILLMITASLFVLTIIMVSAILLGKQVIKVLERPSYPKF